MTLAADIPFVHLFHTYPTHLNLNIEKAQHLFFSFFFKKKNQQRYSEYLLHSCIITCCCHSLSTICSVLQINCVAARITRWSDAILCHLLWQRSWTLRLRAVNSHDTFFYHWFLQATELLRGILTKERRVTVPHQFLYLWRPVKLSQSENTSAFFCTMRNVHTMFVRQSISL